MIAFLIVFLLASEASLAETEGADRAKRQVLVSSRGNSDKKWPRQTVNYYFDRKFESSVKESVLRAMNKLSEHTCVKFSNKSSSYISIKITSENKQSCFAVIGRTFDSQPYNFNSACWTVGQAVHELIHVLGFDHTHTRSDRDTHLNIDMQKLAKSVGTAISQYEVKTPQILYVPYDLGSVMQYDPDGLDGFLPRDMEYRSTMGSEVVAFYDYLMINKYYDCKCDSDLICKNHGYPNPGNCSECNCPYGYGGLDCSERAEPGVTLEATSEWKTTNFSLNAGNDQLDGETKSKRDYIYHFIWITAPANKTIEVEIREHSGLECDRGCRAGGIEVKTLADPRMTSPRFCCADKKNVFKSKNNPTVVMAFNSDGTDEYTLAYRVSDE